MNEIDDVEQMLERLAGPQSVVEVDRVHDRVVRRRRKRRGLAAGSAVAVIAVVVGAFAGTVGTDGSEEIRMADEPSATSVSSPDGADPDALHPYPASRTVTLEVFHAEEAVPDTVDLWFWWTSSSEDAPDQPGLPQWEPLFANVEVSAAQNQTAVGIGAYRSEVTLVASAETIDVIDSAVDDFGVLAVTSPDAQFAMCQGLDDDGCVAQPQFDPPSATRSTYELTVLHSDAALSDRVNVWGWIEVPPSAGPGSVPASGWEVVYHNLALVDIAEVSSQDGGPSVSVVTFRLPAEAADLLAAWPNGWLAVTATELPIVPCTPSVEERCPGEPDFLPTDIARTEPVDSLGPGMGPDSPPRPGTVTMWAAAEPGRGPVELGSPDVILDDSESEPVSQDVMDQAREFWAESQSGAQALSNAEGVVIAEVAQGQLSQPNQWAPKAALVVTIRDILYTSGPGLVGSAPLPVPTDVYVVFDAITGERLLFAAHGTVP